MNPSEKSTDSDSPPDRIDVAALLRLKRFEQPPPGFYEDFLSEFQRRQRVAASIPSLKERISDWFSDTVGGMLPEFRMPSYAYAAVALVAVGLSSWILTAEEVGVASAGGADTGAGYAIVAEDAGDPLRMQIHQPVPEVLPKAVNIPSQMRVGTLPPHYSLDPRPRTESEPFSF